MNLELAESLSSKIEQIRTGLDEIEDDGGKDFIPEKSAEWMKLFKKQAVFRAALFQVTNEDSEIQFNDAMTGFRVVTDENRGRRFR